MHELRSPLPSSVIRASEHRSEHQPPPKRQKQEGPVPSTTAKKDKNKLLQPDFGYRISAESSQISDASQRELKKHKKKKRHDEREDRDHYSAARMEPEKHDKSRSVKFKDDREVRKIEKKRYQPPKQNKPREEKRTVSHSHSRDRYDQSSNEYSSEASDEKSFQNSSH